MFEKRGQQQSTNDRFTGGDFYSSSSPSANISLHISGSRFWPLGNSSLKSNVWCMISGTGHVSRVTVTTVTSQWVKISKIASFIKYQMNVHLWFTTNKNPGSPFWGQFEAFLRLFGYFRSFEATWGHLRSIWGLLWTLEANWGHLKLFEVNLEHFWGQCWCQCWGQFWGLFEVFLAILGHLKLFEVNLEHFWGQCWG